MLTATSDSPRRAERRRWCWLDQRAAERVGPLVDAPRTTAKRRVGVRGRRGRARPRRPVSSGGEAPTSVTVMNRTICGCPRQRRRGRKGSVSEFAMRTDGTLSPLPGSTRALSHARTDPAQMSFSPDGNTLVVTERATNSISVCASHTAIRSLRWHEVGRPTTKGKQGTMPA
jgi:hypothetical protein